MDVVGTFNQSESCTEVHGGVHRGTWMGVWRGVWRYAEVCKGCTEVHRVVCGGPCMSAQRYVKVHTGVQRCAEIC